MSIKSCSHCRDAKYVFEYWLEKVLNSQGIHITEIPREVFKKIPIELLVYCHCNYLLLERYKRPFSSVKELCLECEGTTWRFTEQAEQAGYRLKRVPNLSREEIKALPCEFFDRCPCGIDEQAPRPPEKRKILKEVFDLLKIKVPKLGFGLSSLYKCWTRR